MFSAVRNLKAVVPYILSDLLFVYGSRVNLVLGTPLWLDVEVPDGCVCTHPCVHFFSLNGNYVSSSLLGSRHQSRIRNGRDLMEEKPVKDKE